MEVETNKMIDEEINAVLPVVVSDTEKMYAARVCGQQVYNFFDSNSKEPKLKWASTLIRSNGETATGYGIRWDINPSRELVRARIAEAIESLKNQELKPFEREIGISVTAK